MTAEELQKLKALQVQITFHWDYTKLIRCVNGVAPRESGEESVYSDGSLRRVTIRPLNEGTLHVCLHEGLGLPPPLLTEKYEACTVGLRFRPFHVAQALSIM